ncbi:MAG TPA: isoleucine--tRNA ligase [bacterium]|nr:isoleucine--tRNA ligase [bacterium]
MDYGKTLNLPVTDFPMKANLPVKEQDILKKWEKIDIYRKVLEKNRDRKSFVMHDGPPYANGHIHQGTVLNKILKDIVVKYMNMAGKHATFVPGWDCHGLPIELKAAERLKGKKETMAPGDFRRACRAYAQEFIDIQRNEFKRLGVFADWEHPYITMTAGFESVIAHEFAKVIGSGALLKAKKPVYWCMHCETALAEAEVEYHDHASPSIYVKFPVPAGLPELPGEKVNFVIWTTTPWTLPANLAIALNPTYTYAAVKVRGEALIVADDLKDSFLKAIGESGAPTLATFPADRFTGMAARHPFMDRDSVILYGDHVTLEAGTGCVHTAPGHGQEDYELGRKHGLDTYAPVKSDGSFTDEIPHWAGMKVTKANPQIVQYLFDHGFLLNKPGEMISHSYPCCWRCNSPIIFRATPQWFVSMDDTGLRAQALKNLEPVEFIPAWGKARISGMVENRPNWCVSRQRLWGSPIIAFHCRDCNEQIVDAGLAHAVADLFREHTSDIWYEKEAAHFLPQGFKCPKCGSKNIGKETDILDVWFDSGVTWAAVLDGSKGLEFPADLYLEGSDQHRGWFQSSLLACTVTRGTAPYRQVLTHGYVVDGKGEKISKSKGNFIPPEKTISQFGAEILRLWTSAEDYRDDIRVSEDIINSFVTSYRKIRNTMRFMFGFIGDFEPDTCAVGVNDLASVDKWAYLRWKEVLGTTTTAYEKYEFHRIYHAILDYLTVDLSSVYLDVIKDRYVMKKDDPRRRMSQRAVYEILSDMVRVLAPILSFTAEEAYGFLPGTKKESVFLEEFPVRPLSADEKKYIECWEPLLTVRSGVQKLLEELRTAKTIGHSLDAKVTLHWKGQPVLDEETANLESLFIVSAFEKAAAPDGLTKLSESLDVWAKVTVAEGEKCDRCWKKRPVADRSAEATHICDACWEVIR